MINNRSSDGGTSSPIFVFNRRSFISGILHASALRMLPVGLVLGEGAEDVNANPAAVMTALQIMGALSSLANQASSGLAERLQAINIKLDQVLSNQAHIMSAIAVVQHSLDSLRNDIQGLLTFDLYRMLALDIAEHNIRLRQFSESVRYDFEGVKQSFTKRAEYQSLLIDIRKLSSRFNSLVSQTDLLQQNVGSKGLNSILVIAPALVVLPYSLRLLYTLEGLYDDIGWNLLDYQQVSQTLADTLDRFMSAHLEQVADYQFAKYKEATDEWFNKFSKGKEGKRTTPAAENTTTVKPGDGHMIVSTEQYLSYRCYVSKQFRAGSINHGLFYKNVFSVPYDQITETVPFNWTKEEKIDAFIKISPRPIAEIRRDWYDLEYRDFLSDEPRVVSIGERTCVELTDPDIGQSAKKPYDPDADKNKVLEYFNQEFVEPTSRRNQQTLQLIQVERVNRIADSMRINMLNMAHRVENYRDLEQTMKPYGGFHWKPFDPKTEIQP